jgi:hypothetical protein
MKNMAIALTALTMALGTASCTSAAPTGSPHRSSPHTRTGAVAAAGCAAGQLGAALEGSSEPGTGGTALASVYLWDKSATACALRGPVTVAGLDTAGRQITTRVGFTIAPGSPALSPSGTGPGKNGRMPDGEVSASLLLIAAGTHPGRSRPPWCGREVNPAAFRIVLASGGAIIMPNAGATPGPTLTRDGGLMTCRGNLTGQSPILIAQLALLLVSRHPMAVASRSIPHRGRQAPTNHGRRRARRPWLTLRRGGLPARRGRRAGPRSTGHKRPECPVRARHWPLAAATRLPHIGGSVPLASADSRSLSVREVPGPGVPAACARAGLPDGPVRALCCDDAAMDGAEIEVPLTGGRVARGVVRVGDTVRRPLTDDSERIHRLLVYFERSGFEAAPKFLGVDARGREILTFIEGFAPPHNGFCLTEEAVAAGARLVRRVHDLTAGTEFAAGSEVACHPNLSQQNWIFRDMIPVAIIDWDRTAPGTRVSNFAEFLWAFVHPAVYGEGKPAARMLAVAAGTYGWAEGGLVNAMVAIVRNFVAVNPEFIKWGAGELAHLERNADLFRVHLGG